MNKFFGNLEVMLNGPFDDQQASKGQLFRYLKALNKLERKLDGTAP